MRSAITIGCAQAAAAALAAEEFTRAASEIAGIDRGRGTRLRNTELGGRHIATLQRRRKINWNQADASIDQSCDTRIGRRNIVTEKPAWEVESAGHADVVDGSRGREWDVP